MSDLSLAAPWDTAFRADAPDVGRRLAKAGSAVGDATRSEADLKSASEQFEALLLNFMIREMRATVPESGLFNRCMAEEMFTGMLDEQVAGKMAASGGIGLSRLIFDQLKRDD
jgi:flagellar protein FlgJ